MTVSGKNWSEEHNFLEPEDITGVFIAKTDAEDQTGPVRGYDREEVYFEFPLRRSLTVRELSPELSTSILEHYDFDPYSEDPFLDSEVLGTQDGDEFLRIGYRDDAVYFALDDSSLPTEPEYIDAETPRWRS